jgi:hypothetical protein
MMIDELPPTLTRVDPATQKSAEYIRADVAQARIAAAEDMATQAVQAAVTKQAQLDAANARIAELEAAQAWVSVDERLPELIVDVLVADSDMVAAGYLRKGGTWNVYGWSGEYVTHWMPLPPPPVTDVTP